MSSWNGYIILEFEKGAAHMNFLETVKMVEGLPYESRLGFIGFCVEQCLNEASRHPIASQQLKNLSLLKEGLAILWARAEHNQPPESAI